MELRLFEMSLGRRILLLLLAAVGAITLGIVLSAAFAHPASAATLPGPLPLPESGPVPAPDSVPVSLPATPPTVSAVTTSATTAAATPTTLPTDTVPALPVISIPSPLLAITRPASSILTGSARPTGTAGATLSPGTGGPAHGRKATISGPSARRSLSHGGSFTGSPSGSPAPLPTPGPTGRLPFSPFHLVPSISADAPAPGHGNSPWNVLPLAALALGLLALAGLVGRRRLFPRLLFASRPTPPG